MRYISEEEAEDYRMERKMLRNPPPDVCVGCGEPFDALPGEYCETCVEARQERDPQEAVCPCAQCGMNRLCRQHRGRWLCVKRCLRVAA